MALFNRLSHNRRRRLNIDVLAVDALLQVALILAGIHRHTTSHIEQGRHLRRLGDFLGLVLVET